MAKEYWDGSDIKLLVKITGMGFDQSVNDYTIDIYNAGNKITFHQSDLRSDSEGNYYLPIPRTELQPGTLTMVVTGVVPDSDFQSGVRVEVAKPIKLGKIQEVDPR